MKDLEKQLEKDIVSFIENIEKQSNSDKIQTLKLLFDKYLHLNQTDLMMDYFDLSEIIERSKSIIVEQSFPVYLGEKKRKVPEYEQANMCVIESTISYLNKHGCLKKIPKFDKRKDKF